MRFKKIRKLSSVSQINVTPFVDVMLVLLIIFMVTSPMLVAGIHVDLPEASTTPINSKNDPISITINSKEQIYVQEIMVEKSDLVQKLKAITNEKFSNRIFVRGDKNVEYGKVIEIMGLIGAAGFNKISLVTEVSDLK